jgi:hypothetical protein
MVGWCDARGGGATMGGCGAVCVGKMFYVEANTAL